MRERLDKKAIGTSAVRREAKEVVVTDRDSAFLAGLESDPVLINARFESHPRSGVSCRTPVRHTSRVIE
jgi:hypothetical protein